MKKLILSATVTCFILLVSAVPGYSQSVLTEDFVVSADIPEATGMVIDVTKIEYVDGGSDIWLDEDVGTSINFGELDLGTFVDPVTDAVYRMFTSPYYYAIDVGVDGVLPDSGMIQSSYVETLNPNALNPDPDNRGGLSTHATAVFAKVEIIGYDPVDGQIEEETALGVGKYLLGNLPSGVSFNTIRGGWLRVYVGLVNKDPEADYPDPDAGIPFSPGDMGGLYEGTITLTWSAL